MCSIAGGDTTLTWLQDSLACAEGHDDNQWTGLHTATAVTPTGVLIHPDRLREPDDPPTSSPPKPSSGGTGDPPGGDPGSDPGAVPPTEFYAQFKLSFVRCIK